MDNNKLALRIITCGAKNSTIARALMDNGFVIPTFGWDYIDEWGNYMQYNNKTNEWDMDNFYLGIAHETDKVINDPFIYSDSITPQVVSILKRYLKEYDDCDIFTRVWSWC